MRPPRFILHFFRPPGSPATFGYAIGAVQTENNGLMERYLYTGSHEAIISDEMFMAVQQEKFSRSKEPQNHIAMKLSL